MKGDFTRNTFRREKHYSRVLQQQGRVQLDADWNEALDILTYRDRTARLDIIGSCCAPEGNPGFEVTVDGGNLRIGSGRYYVHGILVENEESHLFTEQDDLPGAALPTAPGRYLAYLDVWERHITVLEDPEILEVALGGPDTSTRAKIIAQVKLAPVASDAGCSDIESGWHPAGVESTGQLAARSQPGDEEPDPCIVPPSAGYRRLENQLYRVEIRDPGPIGTATFLFSRENGSVVTEWLSQDGDVLTVASAGRDENLGFRVGNWLELTDDSRELQGRRGVLVRLADVQGKELTIDSSTIDNPDNPGVLNIADFSAVRKIRRWDSDGAMLVDVPTGNDGYIPLEGGVEVHFGPAAANYQTGDYWLIPARTNLGDVLWPKDETTNTRTPEARHGTEHYYCSLALLDLSNTGWTQVSDCRCLFPPLSDLPEGIGECCCTVTVGDDALSVGDFNDIQEAVNAVDDGGKVCILPGTYPLRAPVQIDERDIVISGCGKQTHVVATAGQPAFVAQRSEVVFDSLTVSAGAPDGAIVLHECRDSHVRNCLVRNSAQQVANAREVFSMPREFHHGLMMHRAVRGIDRLATGASASLQAAGPAIAVFDSRRITLEDNALLGLPAIQLQAREADVRRNFATGGGIWVWDGSILIDIVDNNIQKGSGAGVLLGGVRKGSNLLRKEAGVRLVVVHHNHILGMAHNGIGSATELDGIAGLGDLEDITITDNLIAGCARRPQMALDGDGIGGIVLNNSSRMRLVGNEIVQNGPSGQPACGILLQECEGAEIVDNYVDENGSTGITPQRCIDFRPMAPEADDKPLEIDGTTFRNSVTPKDGNMYHIESNVLGAGIGSGLRCHEGLEIQLSEDVNTVSLLFVGNPASVTALDSAGNQLVTESDSGSQPTTAPRTITLKANGIRHLSVKPTARLWLLEICAGAVAGYQAGIAALFMYGGEYEPASEQVPFPSHVAGRAALTVHGNTVICPVGQALWAVGIGRILVNDNIFTSLGEYTQPVPPDLNDDDDNQDFWLNVAQIGRCVSILDLGIALELVNLLTGGMARTNIKHVASFGLAANPRLQREIPPGFIQCHGNQVSLSLSPAAARIALPAVLLASFDDVALQDNQIRSNISGGIQIADTFAVGATARVNDNRLTEQLNTAFASCVSYALFNNTTNNIATHCILAAGGNVVDSGNQVINAAACGGRQSGFVGAVAGLATMGGGS